MTHPEELLADYAEGTLAERERALVREHLSTCAVCREELELAANAVSALATLEERPVPLGVTGPVLMEAERRFEPRRPAVWQRFQWGAGIAAAAAALVLVVALNLGGDGAEPALRAEGGGAGAAAPDAAAEPEQFQLIEKQDRNYAEADVRLLLERAARTARAGDNGATVPQESGAAGGAYETGAAMAAGDAAELVSAAPAIECLRSAEVPVDDPESRLLSVIEARFAGTPALFAALLDTPDAGQAADTVTVWVVARRDCQILSSATSPL